jgi:VWFA-related protein
MRHLLTPVLVCALTPAAIHAQSQPDPVFHAGTRLVQVDVVVRDKHGPVPDLTKSDFTVYDYKVRDEPWSRKEQPIQVFQAAGALNATLKAAVPLPPGAVSNRAISGGEPVNSATIVLLDQLNTGFDRKAYERTQVVEFLKKPGLGGRIALYSLGRNLHVLQDFTDDPKKLIQSVANEDSGDNFIPADSRDAITMEALAKIVQHFSGVPGRKNLIWIKDSPTLTIYRYNADKVRTLLSEANIAMYPVLVRSVGNAFSARFTLGRQHAARDLGASTGATGFDDAGDIDLALHRADQDSKSAYMLGFYPAESDLDGKPHRLLVTLSKELTKRGLELEFRTEYIAALKPTVDPPSLADTFDSPLNATGIGLTASVAPMSKPGDYEVKLVADLSDIRMEQRADRWEGSLKMAVRLEWPGLGGVETSQPVIRPTVVSLDRHELDASLERGLVLRFPVRPGHAATAVRIVIQDVTSGAFGSLRVPIPGK